MEAGVMEDGEGRGGERDGEGGGGVRLRLGGLHVAKRRKCNVRIPPLL